MGRWEAGERGILQTTEERAHALARLRRALQVCSRTKSLIQVYTRTTTSCVYFHTNFLGILSYQTHQAGAQVCTCTAVLFKCGSKPFKSWELQSAQNRSGAQKSSSFYQVTAHAHIRRRAHSQRKSRVTQSAGRGPREQSPACPVFCV